MTPTHGACFITNGVIGDCGVAAAPYMSTGGVQPGPFCVNSGPQTGSYQSFCLNANATTGGILSIQNFGGAPAGGISFNINGTPATFPTVVTPTITGDLASFNNTTGTLIDSGILGSNVPLLNASNIWSGPCCQVGFLVQTSGPFSTSNNAASNAFVQNAIRASMATMPLAGITGGTYSFASNGTQGVATTITASGGAITGITGGFSSGTGWKVGDLFTLTGSVAGNGDAVLRVLSLSGSTPATFEILYGGTGYSSAANANFVAPPTLSSFTLTLTGTLTSNATFVMPKGTYLATSDQWIVNNNTTGAFTMTVKISNGSDSATGTGVVVPQGSNNSTATFLQTDGVNDVWLGSAITTLAWSSITGTPTTLSGYGITDARPKLTGTTNYYVRTDGNDNCNGLTNAAGSSGACAFATVNKGLNVICTQIDTAGFNVNLRLQGMGSSATYTTNVNTCNWLGYIGNGFNQFTVLGENGTVTLQGANGNASPVLFSTQAGAPIVWQNLTISPSNATSVNIEADDNGFIALGGNITFAGCTGSGIIMQAILNGSRILLEAPPGTNATVTITIATPGVVTWANHGLTANAQVVFTTTGALPTGLATNTIYYVVGASITTNTFQVSATPGGGAINTSGSQSGTQTAITPQYTISADCAGTFFYVHDKGQIVAQPNVAFALSGSRTIGTLANVDGISELQNSASTFAGTTPIGVPYQLIVPGKIFDTSAQALPATLGAVLTPLAPGLGGTGVLNGPGSTITLGAALTTTGAGAPTLAFPGSARTYTFPNASTTLLSSAGAVSNHTIANPTGTTSISIVMMGLGSTCTITPLYSTRVTFSFGGSMANSTGGDGAVAQVIYGTGSAPANGAASTGTALANITMTGGTAATGYPFYSAAIATGLTPGTAYWFDLGLEALTGGTASIVNPVCVAHEM